MALPDPHTVPGPQPVGSPVHQSLSVQRVNAAPSETFIYSFPPEGAQLLDVPKATVGGLECPGGKFWLPQQIRILNVSGVNGVRVLNKDESPSEAWRFTLQLQAEKGAVVIAPDLAIPAEALPDGAPAGGYLRQVAVAWRNEAGLRYITPWDLCSPVPGDAPAKWSFDRQKYALWLWWLVAAGYVPAPHPAYVDAQKGALRDRVSEVEARNNGVPEDQRKRKVKAAEAVAEAAEKASTPARVPRK